jgi:hypothetical protein
MIAIFVIVIGIITALVIVSPIDIFINIFFLAIPNNRTKPLIYYEFLLSFTFIHYSAYMYGFYFLVPFV